MAELNIQTMAPYFLLLVISVLICDSSGREFPHRSINTSGHLAVDKGKLLVTVSTESLKKGDNHNIFKQYLPHLLSKKDNKHTGLTSQYDETKFSEIESRSMATKGDDKEVTVDGYKHEQKTRVPEKDFHVKLGSQSVSFDSKPTYSVSQPFGSTGHPLISDKTEGKGHKTQNQVATSVTSSNLPTTLAKNSQNPFLNKSPFTLMYNTPSSIRSLAGNSDQNKIVNNRSSTGNGVTRSGSSNVYKDIVKQILINALAIIEGELPATNNPDCNINGLPCLSTDQTVEDLTMERNIASYTQISRSAQKLAIKSPKMSQQIPKLTELLAISKNESDEVQDHRSKLSLRSYKPDTRQDQDTAHDDPHVRSIDRSKGNGNNNNNNDNINSGNQNGSGGASSNSYPSSSASGVPVDQNAFNRFASETMSFERQSASEITRLDNLLRQLALAAQTDFSTVTASFTAMRQELLQSQQQLVQAWNLLNRTHSKDNGNTLSELHDIKTDVYRLHALLTGATPLGQSTAQGRVAEVREDTRAGLDCAALAKSGVNSSGVYDLQPDPSNNQTRMTAYCDMDTNGGGWTVFQRRKDGSDDFFRGWNSYKHGFGSYHHDHWLGLENIHLLTKYGDNVMRIELMDWENETRWAEFSYTRIMGESDGYRILVGGYHGNAGDPFHSLSYDMRMQSMRFSTFDSDNDMDNGGNCALTFTSGWWFNKCFQINLNGVWYGSSRYAGPSMNGIVWDLWPQHFNGYSLKQTEMKLRPANFLRTK